MGKVVDKMDRKSFIYYLANVFKILHEKGHKTFLNPINAFSTYAGQTAYQSDQLVIKSLDYSFADLMKNREMMERFRNMKSTSVERAPDQQ